MDIKQPSNYQQWAARLYSSNDPGTIVTAATNMAVFDKKRARYDVARILADRYETDKNRAKDNMMVQNTLKRKYELLAEKLFGGSIESMIAYGKSAPPS